MLAMALTLGGLFGACSERAESEPPVLVLAAASVGDAVREIGDAYEGSTGTPVRVSAAASNTLARQAIAGSPGDLFLSASETWGEAVTRAGLAKDSVGLLGNVLVLVVPADNPAGIRVPHDLAQPKVERIALGGEGVPAGVYGQEALQAIGMWKVVDDRIVRAESVRAVLAYVERGEVDAGIVYATDAKASEKVRVIYEFEPGMHGEIVYPLVLLSERGRGLFEFMRSEAARSIFERHAFVVRDAGAGGSP